MVKKDEICDTCIHKDAKEKDPDGICPLMTAGPSVDFCQYKPEDKNEKDNL